MKGTLNATLIKHDLGSPVKAKPLYLVLFTSKATNDGWIHCPHGNHASVTAFNNPVFLKLNSKRNQIRNRQAACQTSVPVGLQSPACVKPKWEKKALHSLLGKRSDQT